MKNKVYSNMFVSKIKNATHMTNTNRHNNRIIESDTGLNEHIFRNVDMELSHRNIHIIECKDVGAAIMERIEKTKVRLIESDKESRMSVLCSSVILGASPEYFQYAGESEFENWLDVNRKFAEQRFGKENIIQMVCHVDEKTPHIHVLFTPIYTNKKGILRLSASNWFDGPAKLRKFHTEYSAFLKENGIRLERGESGIRNEHKGAEEYSRSLARAKEEEIDLSAKLAEIQSFAKQLNTLGTNAKTLLKNADKTFGELKDIIINIQESHNHVVQQRELDSEKVGNAHKTVEKYEKRRGDIIRIIEKTAKNPNFANSLMQRIQDLNDKKADILDEDVFSEFIQAAKKLEKAAGETKEPNNFTIMKENKMAKATGKLIDKITEDKLKGVTLTDELKNWGFKESDTQTDKDIMEMSQVKGGVDWVARVDMEDNLFIIDKDNEPYYWGEGVIELNRKLNKKEEEFAKYMESLGVVGENGILKAEIKARKEDIGGPISVKDSALIHWLKEECRIDKEVMDESARECRAEIDGIKIRGIGFSDDSGNIIVQNKTMDLVLKLNGQASRDVRTIKDKKSNLGKKLILCENMIDYLALKTLKKSEGVEVEGDVVILNGLGEKQIEKIIRKIPKETKTIVSYLPETEKNKLLLEKIKGSVKVEIKKGNKGFSVMEDLLLKNQEEKEKTKKQNKGLNKGGLSL